MRAFGLRNRPVKMRSSTVNRMRLDIHNIFVLYYNEIHAAIAICVKWMGTTIKQFKLQSSEDIQILR